MADPINPNAQWPGDNMNPDQIEHSASKIKSVGSNVSTTGGNVAKAWSGLNKGYHAPEQETLFGAMRPATKAADDFATDMGKVCAALTTFAGEVRTIKKNVAAIRASAQQFVAGIHNGKVTITQHVVENRAQYEMGESTTTSKEVDWNSDQATVEQNNALIRKVNDQQEQLWAAERTCANAIRDVYGAPHIFAASQSNPNGYGVDQIPDNASNLPWGNTVDVKESCGDKVADGVFIDGIANGLGGLIGFHYTQETATTPEHAGFSWSTLGHTWEGVGQLATGIATGPLTPALASLPGPVGKWFNASTETYEGFVPSLLGINVFNHDPNKMWYQDFSKDPFSNWKNDPARTAGSVGFNIATFAIPGPKGLGAFTKAGKAAEVADKAGDVGDASRAADGLGDLSKITGDAGDLGKTAEPAGKTALADLGKTTDDLGDGLNGLGKTDIDVPNAPHDSVNVDHPNVGDHEAAPQPRDPGHAGTGNEPGTTGHEPAASGHEPAASGHEPTASGHEPAAPGHEPAAPGHEPATSGHDGAGHDGAGHDGAGHDGAGHDGAGHDGTGNHGHDSGSGQGDGTKESPRRYTYSNPAENLRGTHEPTPSQLEHIGPHEQYAPGSADHMVARWHEYHGKWGWDRWRDNYIRNQGHHARGVAYEQAYADAKHLNGSDWSRNSSVKNQTGVDRNYDFVSNKHQEAIEMKSGDKVETDQIAKDRDLVDAGWSVHYVFGKEPTQAAIDAIKSAGADYTVFYGEPVLVK